MKKNLLIIVPSLQLGGQERVAVNTATIMSDIYNVTMVIFDSRMPVYKPTCTVIDLKIPAISKNLYKVKNALLRAIKVRKLKRDKNIDFTISFGTTANLVNVLSGYNSHTFISIHGYGSVSHNLMGAYMYRKSRKIACVSKVITQEISTLYKLPPGKAVTLYNPYDLSIMQIEAQEPVTDYVFSPNTIVTHGRLEEVKNYPRLIKSFSIVRSQIPDSQLLIIGEGSQKPLLKNLISSYHLDDSVTLIGFRENPFSYLEKSSLYVLSSYSEGFPNALIEGMIFLPVISVDCKSGPREILSDGPSNQTCNKWEEADYGILVQPAKDRIYYDTLTEDDHVLSDAIISLLKSPKKRSYFKKQSNYRANFFSYEKYRLNLHNLFEQK